MWRLVLLLLISCVTFSLAERKTEYSLTSAKDKTTITQISETGYWINSSTGKRHNKSCRYYGKGKHGKPCEKSEGKPCKICGG